MKRISKYLMALFFLLSLNNIASAQKTADTSFTSNGNPIIKHKYTADPAALVYKNKVYLYTGHDQAPAKRNGYEMHEWLCFSTEI